MNEYDLRRRYDRIIFWGEVTREAAIIALVLFVTLWIVS